MTDDYAGAAIVGPSSTTVVVDNKPVALLGDSVSGHGEAPHVGATLVGPGAQKLLVDSQVPAKAGTLATCGHSVTPGSSTVIVS